MQPDKTPPSIDVWVCPTCGYWRQERSSGVHVAFNGNGPGDHHYLVEARYIFETELPNA